LRARRSRSQLTWRQGVVRAVRLPFDVIFLVFDYLRLTLWLIAKGLRRVLRLRPRPFRPCLKGLVADTALGKVRHCQMIGKYGNPFVFMLLFPGVRSLEDSAGKRFHSWGSVRARSPISLSRYVAVSLVAGLSAGALGTFFLRWQAPTKFLALRVRLGLTTPVSAPEKRAPERLPELARQLALAADGLAASGHHDAARAKYQDAVRADSTNVAAQVGLGTVALALGQRDVARLAFTEALGRDPTLIAALRGLSQLYLEDTAPEQAAVVLDRLLKQVPDDLQGLVLRAKAHAALGEEELANALINRACEAHADAAEGWQAKGDFALARARPADADAAYQQALRCAPDSIEARLGRLRAQAAQGQVQALPEALALRTEQPDREEVALLVVDLLQRAGRLPEALRLSEQISWAHPDFVSLRTTLGGLYIRTGRPNEAYKLAAEVLTARPGAAGAHLQIATILLDASLPALAVDYCRKAVAQEPLNPVAQQGLGRALLADGQAAAAREVLAAVVKQFRETYAARLLLARCDLQTGREEEGRTTLRQLATERPEDVEVLSIQMELEWRKKRIPEALEFSRKAYAVAPHNLMVINNYAAMLAYTKQDLDEALRISRQAFTLAPDQPMVADTLGWILVLRGEASEALPLLAYAARRSPAAGEVQYHFAVALQASGRADEARQYLELALASGADFIGIEDAKALLARLPGTAPAPP
jgi:predicted Zn-dependent protease